MSSLRARLARPPVSSRGHSCSVGFLLVKLASLTPTDDPTSEFIALVNALVDPQWSSTALAKLLTEEGYNVSERHLRAHRRDVCTTATCAYPNTGLLR